MTAPLRCSPADYQSAAQSCARLYDDGAGAVSTLGAGLSGGGAMAGSDTAGATWVRSYNPGARSAGAVLADLVSGLGSLADRLQASGANHAAADAASNGEGAQPSVLPPTMHAEVAAPALPDASGGGGGEPPGWGLIAPFVGEVWASGHQDRLRAAGRAWTGAAQGCTGLARGLDPVSGIMDGQQSPEVPNILSELSQMRSLLDSVGDKCRQLAQGCDAYAAALDAAHRQILQALAAAVELASPSNVVSTAVDVLTGDVHAVDDKLRKIAADVRVIINALVGVGERIGSDLSVAAAGLAGLSETASAFVGREVHNATAEVVNFTATLGATLLHHPEDAATIAVSAAAIVAGAGGEVGGLALDATGGGAVAGVPVNVASAGLIATGATGLTAGAVKLGQDMAGEPGATVMHTDTGGGSVPPRTQAPDGTMLGKNGVQVTSNTTGQSPKGGNGPKFRLDVENPDPGGRPGQLHLQDDNGNKYYYNFNTKEFEGAPQKYIEQISRTDAFKRAIKRAADFLGVG